jgi:hypothetical protein
LAAVVMIAYRTLTGTRQVILSMLIVTVMSLLSSRGDFRFPVRLVATGMLLIPLSVVGFAAATTVRDYWDFSRKAGHYLRPSEFVDAYVANNDAPQSFRRLLFPLFFRLNGTDAVAIILSDTGVDLERFVSPSNDLKSFINVVMPGTPFPQAYEPSKTFLVVYRNYPMEYLSAFYATTMWTLWGYVYAEFGWWPGLEAVFAIGLLLAVVYGLFLRWHSGYAPYAQVWWLLSGYAVYNSFGFDTDAATSLYQLMAFVDTLILLTLFKRWGEARRRGRTRTTPRRRAVLAVGPRLKARA